ncbi:MAG: hypothetical protein V9G20_01365 [Candidatus Promineifilaceae bacterium]
MSIGLKKVSKLGNNEQRDKQQRHNEQQWNRSGSPVPRGNDENVGWRQKRDSRGRVESKMKGIAAAYRTCPV